MSMAAVVIIGVDCMAIFVPVNLSIKHQDFGGAGPGGRGFPLAHIDPAYLSQRS